MSESYSATRGPPRQYVWTEMGVPDIARLSDRGPQFHDAFLLAGFGRGAGRREAGGGRRRAVDRAVPRRRAGDGGPALRRERRLYHRARAERRGRPGDQPSGGRGTARRP